MMEKIAKYIKEASLIIADLTGKNANVFYELGLAHAMKKRVVLITQSKEDIPSDLKPFEYIEYDSNNSDNIGSFESKLKKFLQNFKSADPFYYYPKIKDIQADKGNAIVVDAGFLKSNEGTINIWVKITDEMNQGNTDQDIFSHCSNNGKKAEVEIANEEEGTKFENKYINLFALRKNGKNPKNPNGFWKFVCTDAMGNTNRTTSKNILDPGWHMFSVTWSRNQDAIKVYIDKEFIQSIRFKFWPEKIERHLYIGTWPNRAKKYYINTEIRNISIFNFATEYEALSKIYDEEKELSIN